MIAIASSSVMFKRCRKSSIFSRSSNISVCSDLIGDDSCCGNPINVLAVTNLNSKFGKVNTLVFRPLVQSGRIFKAKESVTIWITDDANKIPIQMRASLSVGSLRAELEAYKGLSNPFTKSLRKCPTNCTSANTTSKSNF